MRPLPITGRLHAVERVTVTRVVVLEGDGVPGSIAREVEHWFIDDGRCIAAVDAFEGTDHTRAERAAS